MSISYNWFRFESHWTHLRDICDANWLGTTSEKSKAENNVVPINLPTTSGDNRKCYDKLYYTIMVVITTPLPTIYRIV